MKNKKYLILFFFALSCLAMDESSSSSSTHKRVRESDTLSGNQKKAKLDQEVILPTKNIFMHLQNRSLDITPPRPLYRYLTSLKCESDVIAISRYPNSSKLASISENDNAVTVWDLKNFELITKLEGHEVNPRFVNFFTNSIILSFDDAFVLKVWLSNESETYNLQAFIDEMPKKMLFSWCEVGAVFDQDCICVEWIDKFGYMNGFLLHPFERYHDSRFVTKPLDNHNVFLIDCEYSRMYNFIVSRCEGSVYLYDNKFRYCDYSYITWSNVHCMKFSPNENFLAFAIIDRILICDSVTRESVTCIVTDNIKNGFSLNDDLDEENLEVHCKGLKDCYANVVDMAFSEDNKYLIASFDNGITKMWQLDLKNERPIGECKDIFNSDDCVLQEYIPYNPEDSKFAKNFMFFDNDNKFLFTLGNEIQIWSK